jgi:hypothetical protein
MNTQIRVMEGRRVPVWAVEMLGCRVQLSKPFKTAVDAYPAGTQATLVSIQSGRRSAYATIVFDRDDTCEENVDFSGIRPL